MTPGLIVFIVVLIIDGVTLLIDLPLWLDDGPTVSKWVKAHPWSVVPIVALQLLGTAGLTAHLLED